MLRVAKDLGFLPLFLLMK